VVKTVGRVGCVGFLATSKLCWTDVLELWARVEVMGVVMTGAVSVRLEGETIVEVFGPVPRVCGAWSEHTRPSNGGGSVGNVSDGWIYSIFVSLLPVQCKCVCSMTELTGVVASNEIEVERCCDWVKMRIFAIKFPFCQQRNCGRIEKRRNEERIWYGVG
jgi:hypothetical protein